MRKDLIISLLLIFTLSGCSDYYYAKKDRNCIHNHICCQVGCPCCDRKQEKLAEMYVDQKGLLKMNKSELVKETSKLTGDHYVYNYGKDTIYFTKLNYRSSIPFPGCQPKIVDFVQINGTGSKEVIFLRECLFIVEDHGGTFDISESTRLSKYEIWDLDSKTLLFEARSSFQKNCQNYKMNSWKSGIYSYAYDFSIDAEGMITISNLKEIKSMKTTYGDKEVESVYLVVPDKAEGSYKFVDSTYIKME